MAKDGAGTDILRNYPPVLNTEQVCEVLHINRKTLYKMIDEGVLPGTKSGKGYKIARANVVALLNRKGGGKK